MLALFAYAAEAKPFTGFGAEVDSYIRLAANRYQVSEAMLRGLVKFEDGWTGKISPTGATGVGQFTVGTWNWLSETPRGRELGMRPVTKYNRGTSYDPRRNKYINTLATALLARWHIEQFKERRIIPNAENIYMAHNIGLDGLHRALLGRSTKSDIENMRKNGMKRWMTVSDFIAYQKGRYINHKAEANFISASTKSATLIPVKEKTNTKPAQLSSINLPKIRYQKTEKPAQSSELAMRSEVREKALKWIEPSQRKVIWVTSN